jgi:hypothetical protein
MKRFSRKKKLALVGLALAGALTAGTALATIGDGGVINACYKKDGGALRVIDVASGSCTSKEGGPRVRDLRHRQLTVAAHHEPAGASPTAPRPRHAQTLG